MRRMVIIAGVDKDWLFDYFCGTQTCVPLILRDKQASESEFDLLLNVTKVAKERGQGIVLEGSVLAFGRRVVVGDPIDFHLHFGDRLRFICDELDGINGDAEMEHVIEPVAEAATGDVAEAEADEVTALHPVAPMVNTAPPDGVDVTEKAPAASTANEATPPQAPEAIFLEAPKSPNIPPTVVEAPSSPAPNVMVSGGMTRVAPMD